MAKRKVYHVLPNGSGSNGWKLLRAGSKRATAVGDNKQDLIKRGRELAKEAELGQLKIHRGDGVIQEEYTYGKDPRKYKS